MKLLTKIIIVLLVSYVSARSYGKTTQFKFRGLMAPVYTPFKKLRFRSLDLSVIPKYAKFLASKNINGILVGGTTGEGLSLSVNERKKLAEAWADAAKDNKQHLMIHVGGVALVDVKELAAHAESISVDSLLCLPDLYSKPANAEALVNYLQAVSESALNTPLIYYQSTGAPTNVKASDLLKSVGDRIPTFAGVKLDSSDIKDGVNALAVANNFAVIYGSKMPMLAGCVVGIETFMTGTLNFVPENSFKILDFCHGKGDFKTAQESQNFLSALERTITAYGNNIAAMKTATSLITKIPLGPVRAPLKPLQQQEVDAMAEQLSKIGLISN
ncbi:N-acetylneuraminate lyase-like [Phymastichus coffea]|uniref:N-acetylneuraminate lyase-like n=1 Tax=Phymastichus coffea TaxID=108790 RepID=UPI00273A9E56|nr:N-acetylneuraminate lyase-like [Phymastichus coffea]